MFRTDCAEYPPPTYRNYPATRVVSVQTCDGGDLPTWTRGGVLRRNACSGQGLASEKHLPPPCGSDSRPRARPCPSQPHHRKRKADVKLSKNAAQRHRLVHQRVFPVQWVQQRQLPRRRPVSKHCLTCLDTDTIETDAHFHGFYVDILVQPHTPQNTLCVPSCPQTSQDIGTFSTVPRRPTM